MTEADLITVIWAEGSLASYKIWSFRKKGNRESNKQYINIPGFKILAGPYGIFWSPISFGQKESVSFIRFFHFQPMQISVIKKIMACQKRVEIDAIRKWANQFYLIWFACIFSKLDVFKQTLIQNPEIPKLPPVMSKCALEQTKWHLTTDCLLLWYETIFVLVCLLCFWILKKQLSVEGFWNRYCGLFQNVSYLYIHIKLVKFLSVT